MPTVQLGDARTAADAGVLGLAAPALREGRWPLLLASVGINLLALALPIFILQIYDRVLPNGATTTLAVLVAGLCVAVALDTALRALRAHVATWLGARFEHIVRTEAVERILRAPLPAFERDTPGSYLERINAVGTMRDFHASQILLALVDLPFALLFLALIAYLGAWLVLVPLTLLAAFGGLALWVGSALRTSVAARASADKRRYDFLIEVLRGIHTVKALALNALMRRRQECLQEESATAVRRVMYQASLAQTLGSLFSQLNMVALVAFGALLVLDGAMTMGALAACTLLSGRALQPLQMAMGLWTSFQSIRVADAGIADVLSLPDERNGRTARPQITGSIELDGVAFGYDAGGPLLLDGVSLAIKPGEIVGIEGDTGCGKSTLLHLVLGLFPPQRGTIRVDGTDIATIEPGWLRRHIALLPRRGTVYGGTILDNLTDFREGEYVNEALYLSYLLGIDQAIKLLPQGFDTRLGAGEVLPAGLRQRIAIVRELVKHPRIVLFDDADHALDADSRHRLVGLLRQLGQQCSVVVVSSNPQVMRIAGRRYRLGGGLLLALEPTAGTARIREVA